MLSFICSCLVILFLFEPLIINFIYFSNVGLFIDLFLTKKNYKKLKDFIIKDIEKNGHD